MTEGQLNGQWEKLSIVECRKLNGRLERETSIRLQGYAAREFWPLPLLGIEVQ
jgi:hypothetical protein